MTSLKSSRSTNSTAWVPSPSLGPGQRRLQAGPERGPVGETGRGESWFAWRVRLRWLPAMASAMALKLAASSPSSSSRLSVDPMVELTGRQLVGGVAQEAQRPEHLGRQPPGETDHQKDEQDTDARPGRRPPAFRPFGPGQFGSDGDPVGGAGLVDQRRHLIASVGQRRVPPEALREGRRGIDEAAGGSDRRLPVVIALPEQPLHLDRGRVADPSLETLANGRSGGIEPPLIDRAGVHETMDEAAVRRDVSPQVGAESGLALGVFGRIPEGADQRPGRDEVGHRGHAEDDEEDGKGPVPARTEAPTHL